MIRLEDQMRAFAQAGLGLFWQRQATFAGATLLAAYYINLNIALFCYAACQFSEFLDFGVAKRVLKWEGYDDARARRLLKQLTITSILSSLGVVQYIIVISIAEGPSVHFGPLFFLFCAALFTAMNNCQLPSVLTARMAIYAAVFLFIPLYDIWLVRPPMDSDLWKQLGIVVFVLYFLMECTWKFLNSYRAGLEQMDDLRVERDRVSEAYKLQSQFVSVVSHELRTPLTSIKASLDIINLRGVDNLPEDLQRAAQIGQKNSKHLATLIDDLLDFQKLRSGTSVFRFEKTNLVSLAREAAELNRPFGEKKNVSIVGPAMGAPIYAKADADRMMQVLNNILSNAIKFSPDGGSVNLAVEASENQARISVRDSGIGIPENARNSVFGSFAQVDGSDKREFGGIGLGLSIAKQIVEDHGGKIGYESEPGVGTEFFVVLDLLGKDEQLPNSDIQVRKASPLFNPSDPNEPPAGRGSREAGLGTAIPTPAE